MARRNFRIEVFCYVTGILALVGYLWTSFDDGGTKTPERILLQNKGGNVVLDHKMHIDKFKIACNDCHHTGSREKCGACHGVEFDESFIKNHRKTISDVADCIVCHHKGTAGGDSNTTRWAKNDDIDFSAFQLSCSDCHRKPTVAELIPNRMAAFHGSCIKCHEKRGVGPFSKDQCRQCHTN